MSRRMRVWAILWAVLQFALPTGASWADAHVDRADDASVVHIESGTSSSCRPVHSAECAVCQFLSHNLAPLAGGVRPMQAAASEPPAPAVRMVSVAAALEYSPPSRAPPQG